MVQVTEMRPSARLGSFSTLPRRRQVVAALAVVVLVANLVALASGQLTASADAALTAVETTETTTTTTTAAPAEPVEVDPLAGITVTSVERSPALGHASGPLPQPEPAPADPYAATPEIRHGLLEIPAIGLSQPLFEGVTLTAINRGPSHWPGTAMPGQTGNVVVAGHRTTYTKPFWDLQAVQPGDELIFSMADGTRYVYELERTEVVSPDAVHIIHQTPERRATLFACHPRGSARQRIVGHFVMKAPAITYEVVDTVGVRAPAR